MLKHYSNGKTLPINRRLLALLVLALAVLLAGCIEDSDSSDSESLIGDGSGKGTDTSGEVTLSWEPPATREDGEEFSPSEVDRYIVQYRSEDGEFQTVDSPPEIRDTSVDINTLTTGEKYYFRVQVRDNNGLVSDFSEEVSTVVN